MRKLIIVLILAFCQLAHAEILVSVDRDPVVADESFQLIFESDENINDTPDFSPLNKSFTVLNSSTSNNTQIINGKVSHSQKWILTVLANKTGMLRVPPISFGNELSEPRTIKVLASAPASSNNVKGDIYIDVDVSTTNPYVQAQVIYTVKLYWAVPMSNASLSEPKISGGQAVIEKQGDDKSYETQRNGKRYGVNERRYVIYPQSSGQLKIGPLLFQGQTGGGGGIFDFDPFGPQPKSMVKRSKEINLDVKPIPNSFSGKTWLPAKQLHIEEQWSVAPDKLKQGEAATRTLTLKAEGLAASQLPAINDAIPDSFKHYPDQPELEDTNSSGVTTGIRREKMAIIPTSAGDYVMPAIKIPWWNIKTDKMEFAELPERTIHVNASAENVQKQAVDNQVKPDNTAVVNSEGNTNQVKVEPITKTTESPFWKIVSLGLFLLWLFTLMLWWMRQRGKKNVTIKKEQTPSNRYYLKAIKDACKKNDPNEAKQALLEWARIKWPESRMTSLTEIKSHCGADLQMKLDELNNILYGKRSEKWNGADFLKSFESQTFDKTHKNKQAGKLEPLYKT